MRFGVNICIITDSQGRKGLHVSPSLEGSQLAKNIFVALLISLACAGSLWLIASTPDPEIKPAVTIMGGY
jgi:hypothetical protein